jgi:mono/diheme cytochrome c family protein
VTRAFQLALAVLVTLASIAIAAIVYVRTTGLVARPEPGTVEVRLARAVRALAVPADARERQNPVPASPDVLAAGRAHYADHCAVCHGNDGRGNTEMGRGLWPKAPDMQLSATQDLTDGELFWIIEHGVRFTGMPGWSAGTSEGAEATWHLVHFIRHLPGISEAEIEAIGELMPRPPAEVRQDLEAERFLRGDDMPAAGEPGPVHGH